MEDLKFPSRLYSGKGVEEDIDKFKLKIKFKRTSQGTQTIIVDRQIHAILDGSDKTNFNKTAPTRKIFSSGVGEKRAKLSTTHCTQQVIPEEERHKVAGLPWTGTTRVVHRRSTGPTVRISLTGDRTARGRRLGTARLGFKADRQPWRPVATRAVTGGDRRRRASAGNSKRRRGRRRRTAHRPAAADESDGERRERQRVRDRGKEGGEELLTMSTAAGAKDEDGGDDRRCGGTDGRRRHPRRRWRGVRRGDDDHGGLNCRPEMEGREKLAGSRGERRSGGIPATQGGGQESSCGGEANGGGGLARRRL
uniref:Uncharacterized protein n=1 Tax=Oryza sativa subsp. japonica TaxID=39947 RepID=Q6Z3P1_ORYSJ|nr:hypothetical protein [Oryza sativa Japonica Group]BAD30570.1 hypothetical protein [Oryza sativa Japonica Group]